MIRIYSILDDFGTSYVLCISIFKFIWGEKSICIFKSVFMSLLFLLNAESYMLQKNSQILTSLLLSFSSIIVLSLVSNFSLVNPAFDQFLPGELKGSKLSNIIKHWFQHCKS